MEIQVTDATYVEKQKHTHVCTAMIVRTINDIMHFLAPYPNITSTIKTKCLMPTPTLTLTLILTQT